MFTILQGKTSTQPSSPPLIYIKGEEYKEIENILNFMYMGQVSLAQHAPSSFLAAASNLTFKGLSKKNAMVTKETVEKVNEVKM